MTINARKTIQSESRQTKIYVHAHGRHGDVSMLIQELQESYNDLVQEDNLYLKKGKPK
jgi:hypothetical protein